MAITSFYFLIFYTVLLLCYYLLPGRIQWLVLLGAGAAFYLWNGQGLWLLHPVAVGLLSYAAGRGIEKARTKRGRKLGLAVALLGGIGSLAALKYTNFFLGLINGAVGVFGGGELDLLELFIPLGISYYTFTMMGYVIDLYFGIGKRVSHVGRFLLLGTYFPTLVSGPIMDVKEMEGQFAQIHRFDYHQVTSGMQRMMWGFFKKLVISERLALVVNTVFGAYESYEGFYFWVAAIFFVLQLYTDFSGCMDIVLGVAESFGLKLPENFRTPFFSKSISEFWRRWHITLGVWMKNYVFYPLLRTRLITNMTAKLKKRLGKKWGKKLPTFGAMFLLWFAVGIWHGPDWKFVLGSGLIHWFYIVLGEICEPLTKKVTQKLKLEGNRIFSSFQKLRTFLLITLAFLFFRADSVESAFWMLRSMFSTWNPGVIFGGTFFTMGLDWVEMSIALVSLLILFVVSLLQERGVEIRESISKKKLPVRWLIWYALLFYTILLGYYGPGYSAAEFIYQGF